MRTHTITNIRKKSPKHYIIEIDGAERLAVCEDMLVLHQLHKGMNISKAQIATLSNEQNYMTVRGKVLRFLGYRARTTLEVKQYLLRKAIPDSICEKIINEMTEKGYINDKKFARDWVKERRAKQYGVFRMRRELEHKGIRDDLISEVLQDINYEDEYESAVAIAEKKYDRIITQPWVKVERKLAYQLVSRGFNGEIVGSILRVFRSRHIEEKGGS